MKAEILSLNHYTKMFPLNDAAKFVLFVHDGKAGMTRSFEDVVNVTSLGNMLQRENWRSHDVVHTKVTCIEWRVEFKEGQMLEVNMNVVQTMVKAVALEKSS